MRPVDLSASPDSYKHGSRARYVAGCRCDACRASNTAYYHARRAREADALRELEVGPPAFEIPIVRVAFDPHSGANRTYRFKNPCPGLGRTAVEQNQGCPWGSYLRKETLAQGVCARCRAETVADHLVDASKMRRRLRWLSKKGVGYKAAADAASVARSVCAAVLNGTKTSIRLSTETRILALDVGAVAGGALVDAAPTWRILDELISEGDFTKTELARRLGYKGDPPALQIGRRKCTARTAMNVAKFYRAITAVAS